MMDYINPPVRRREGMGFGNAGVHIPHANAYPIAGRVRDYHPAGYPGDESMVPHRISVALATTASRTPCSWPRSPPCVPRTPNLNDRKRAEGAAHFWPRPPDLAQVCVR